MKFATFRRAALLFGCAWLIGCHSSRIDATVQNRTGSAIELLEVDYPSASFGVDSLASGDSYHYRFQVRGEGPIKVQYTEAAGHQFWQKTGPEIYERQEGRLDIVLLPGGKTEFHSTLTPQR